MKKMIKRIFSFERFGFVRNIFINLMENVLTAQAV